MSAIIRDRDGIPIEEESMPVAREVKCFSCGKNPDAYWKGHQTVSVCKKCAIEELPKLIIDAIDGDKPDFIYRTTESFRREECGVLLNFHKGISNALDRYTVKLLGDLMRLKTEPGVPDFDFSLED